jgi:hypothetical protein
MDEDYSRGDMLYLLGESSIVILLGESAQTMSKKRVRSFSAVLGSTCEIADQEQ